MMGLTENPSVDRPELLVEVTGEIFLDPSADPALT